MLIQQGYQLRIHLQYFPPCFVTARICLQGCLQLPCSSWCCCIPAELCSCGGSNNFDSDFVLGIMSWQYCNCLRMIVLILDF